MSEGKTIRADHGRWYSAVASSMPASEIREVKELTWKDLDTIHLEVGEPDFPSPDHVTEATHAATTAGRTRYAPDAGYVRLPLDAALGELLERAGKPSSTVELMRAE